MAKCNFIVNANYINQIEAVKKLNIDKKISLKPMWFLAPGSVQARPSARSPIDISGNFSAHVPAKSPSNISSSSPSRRKETAGERKKKKNAKNS